MSAPKGHDNPPVIIVEEKVLTSNGDLLIRKYQRGKFLGKGGFATCFEFTDLETNKRYAAKIIQKEFIKKSRAKQKLMSEIRIHSSLKHPGVVNFEHNFEDSKYVYILLEVCGNETMHEVLRRRKRLFELEIQSHVSQIVNTLKYLHSHKVMHRDLKLSNLFLNEKMEIKLGDFGLAAKIEYTGERKRTICGTPNYIAPEVLDRRLGHSYEVDIWSLGVIMYAMVIGKPPFETDDVQTTYNLIRAGSYSFPESIAISIPLKALISEILVADPAKRPSLDQILDSPFMNQGYVVPRLMPASTLACPLSASFIGKVNRNKPKPTAEQWVPFVPTPISEIMPMGGKEGGGEIQGEAEGEPPVDPDPQPPVEDVASDSDDKQEVHSGSPLLTSPNDKPIFEPHSPRWPNLETSLEPSIWVVKWMDYSSKYGLGYILSNGCTGVVFNDLSKILLVPDGHRFSYISWEAGSNQDTAVLYFLTDPYPVPIQKKVTLLQHFKGFLDKDNSETPCESDEEQLTLIYVKKWIKTKHAVLFRFSNKVIQVVFNDRTEVFLSSDTSLLTYVNKVRERKCYVLDQAQGGDDSELSKRVKYTMEMLARLLGRPSKKKKKKT